MHLMSPNELKDALITIGEERYHDKHPFHVAMNEGRLNRDQIRAWALNRYFYQSQIPVKDSIMLSRLEDAALRRIWRQRILDHDGDSDDEGGLERWFQLTDSLGFERDYVRSTRGILAGTRFAVNAYVDFVRRRNLLEAIASSLTEMFSPGAIAIRVPAMLANYDFVSPQTLAYFDRRLDQAPRDADFALDYCIRYARTPQQQAQVCDALRYKCAILWAQLDALHYAYVAPGHIPPGAFDPATMTAR